MTEYQKTLKKTVRVDGIGLHTGEKVSVAVHPLQANSGIWFRRVDLSGKPYVKASFYNVINCLHATTIGLGRCRISTIEHIMAAFAGLGIDNALVELDGPEVPALDGSAFIFALLFNEAGIVKQEAPKKYIVVKEKISIADGDKKVTFSPSKAFYVDFKIDFNHPAIKSQHFKSKITPSVFVKKISKARTFGFLKEVEFLYKNGLAKGASLDNAIVIGDDSVINKEGLRFNDEFVCHKVLDIIGDLYLLGAPLKAKISAEKSGHALHIKAINELIKNRQAWELVIPEPAPKYNALNPLPSKAAVFMSCSTPQHV